MIYFEDLETGTYVLVDESNEKEIEKLRHNKRYKEYFMLLED